jgi:hypothetical protein
MKFTSIKPENVTDNAIHTAILTSQHFEGSPPAPLNSFGATSMMFKDKVPSNLYLLHSN